MPFSWKAFVASLGRIAPRTAGGEHACRVGLSVNCSPAMGRNLPGNPASRNLKAVNARPAPSTPPCPRRNAGLHPDGYVDFSKLPRPPTTGGGGSSAPFTVTLPVEGVPGLTVQVTIPPLVFLSSAPLYAVADGVLVLNGTPAANEEILQLQFSKPIAGVGLQASIFARGESFTLETNSLSPPMPPSSVNTAGSQTLALFRLYHYPRRAQRHHGFALCRWLTGITPARQERDFERNQWCGLYWAGVEQHLLQW